VRKRKCEERKVRSGEAEMYGMIRSIRASVESIIFPERFAFSCNIDKPKQHDLRSGEGI
jgi:hypothetical protein